MGVISSAFRSHFQQKWWDAQFAGHARSIKLPQRRGTTLINLAVAALIIAAVYGGLFLLKCSGVVDLA